MRITWRVILLSFGLWLLTALPVMVGYLAAPPGQNYLARITIVAADTPAYYSNIEQARQGRLLFANQFTSEPQQPSLFHPLWLVTGWLGAVTQLSTPWVYQIARLAALFLFIWLVDVVVRKIWNTRGAQWLALAIITTSSGLGWLISFGDQQNLLQVPPDRWVAESNTFQSIGHSALFIGTQALLLWWLWMYWRWTIGQDEKPHRWLVPALAGLMIIHPYDVITLLAVAGGWTAWLLMVKQWKPTLTRPLISLGAWVLVCGSLVGAYYLLVVLDQPAMSGWLEQNQDITPNPLIVALGYGLLIPLAIIGAFQTRRQLMTQWLVIWIIVNSLIIYLPIIDFQRRLLSGLHIPVAILAASGLLVLSERVFPRRARLGMVIGLLAVLSITNAKSLIRDVAVQLVPASTNYPVYISQDEYQAMQALGKFTDFSDVIFCEVWTGNAIPGVIGRTVALGHGHQTLQLQTRLRDWLAFTKNEISPAERTAMLRNLRITWLYWRDQDQRENGYNPDQDPRWQLEYQNNSVSLFSLRSDRAQ